MAPPLRQRRNLGYAVWVAKSKTSQWQCKYRMTRLWITARLSSWAKRTNGRRPEGLKSRILNPRTEILRSAQNDKTVNNRAPVIPTERSDEGSHSSVFCYLYSVGFAQVATVRCVITNTFALHSLTRNFLCSLFSVLCTLYLLRCKWEKQIFSRFSSKKSGKCFVVKKKAVHLHSLYDSNGAQIDVASLAQLARARDL